MTFKRLMMYVLLLFSFWACNRPESAERLAAKHCGACHQYPDPSLLNKKTWDEGVFPEMALRMGVDLSKLPGTNPQELHEILSSLPANPIVSEEEWQAIREFYIENAPDSLPLPPRFNSDSLRQFHVTTVTLPISGQNLITMVRRNDERQEFYIGTREGKLFIADDTFSLTDSLQLGSPPSDIWWRGAAPPVFLSMGLMDPNDQFKGAVLTVSHGDTKAIPLIDSLKRPVYIEGADLDQDGDEDLLISSFGNFTGALHAYEKTDTGFQKHILHRFPGTRKTIAADFNGDGLKDILALITQGDEHIALFTNRGKFRFSYQVLLRFPPMYGSSYMEVADFNSDGHVDILYTNGDNADYSAILKPYHGIRIFLNDGRNKFQESWFHPMHGASMTRALDYDEDGDLDIAAISFFPDFKNNPERAFLYFENNEGKFSPFHAPLATVSRWITMEAADIDSDGDTDLIVGALAFPAAVPENLFASWGKKKVSLLVLRNNRR